MVRHRRGRREGVLLIAVIRNNHVARLTVGGVPIRSGATASVPGWSEDLATSTERALLDDKLIEVVGDEPSDEKPKTDKKAKAEA